MQGKNNHTHNDLNNQGNYHIDKCHGGETMGERKNVLAALRKDNMCGKEDEPLAMLIMGAIIKGPNFRKACAFAKLSRNDEKAKKWWTNLHKGGFMTSKKIYFDPESENSGIEFALAINVGMGHLEMKHA